MSPAEWAETYRRMGKAESAITGKFRFDNVPFFKWLLERYHDPRVTKVVCMKSAQIGWTQSIICNLIGYYIDIEHPTCIILLPSGPAVKKFNEEKFDPLIDSNLRLQKTISTKNKDRDVKIDWKKLPGGYIKFVGSNTPDGVKSSTGSRLIVEEPDDCNLNLKGQGDAIKLLEERGKTIPDLKQLIGGTPTVKGASSISDEFDDSDQNYWFVPCPDCKEYQTLTWDQVRWLKDESLNDPIFKHHVTESAHYICAHCGSAWTDEIKNEAVKNGEARAMRKFNGVVGLSLNELYSTLQGSRLQILVKKWLRACREYERGDPDALVPFYNATLGLPYEHKTDIPAGELLRDRCEEYAEGFVPEGGLILTSGVDVQHDRFAISIRAWGRGEESWLVWWGEIHGNVIDVRDPVWRELESILFRPYPSWLGSEMYIKKTSMDSGDGVTADMVYQFVRKHQQRGVMAVKGVQGLGENDAEIFSLPQKKDANYKNTKAAKHGLRVYKVGTSKAKDLLILGRLKLLGKGAGVMHWYKDVRADYFDQLLGEIKAPMRVGGRIKRIWTKKSGARVEVLDTEVYALHAARSMKLNMQTESFWSSLDGMMRQATMFPVELTPLSLEVEQKTEEEKKSAVLAQAQAVQATIAKLEPVQTETETKPIETTEPPKPKSTVNKITGRKNWLQR